MDLCAPALVYLVLSAISFFSMIFMTKDMTASNAFLQAFFVLLWTFLLNALCERGYTALSWVLVILPLILLLIVVVFVGQLVLSGKLMPSPSSGSPSAVTASSSSPTAR
jgi:peptidoglycan/LPS O-acetylase OafA/YrhL